MILSGVGLLGAAFALYIRLTVINWDEMSGLVWFLLSATAVMALALMGMILIVQGLLGL